MAKMDRVRAPLSMTRFDDSQRILTGAVAISLLLHAAVLAIRFVAPDNGHFRREDPRLDVVLVNAHSDQRPTDPQALAQANLDGGGTSEQGRRTSPLPNSFVMSDGDAVDAARQRVVQLEEEQLRLLRSLTHGESAEQAERRQPTDGAPAETGNAEATQRRLQRLEAEITQSISDYQKRPKRQFLMPSTAESRFARYYEDWRARVERVGNENYPEEARGHIYGQLRMTVAINRDGSLLEATIEQSSGSPVLDRAAKRIVKLAAPFAPFPPEIARDTEILEITRTWLFTHEHLSMHAPGAADADRVSPPTSGAAEAVGN